MKLRHFLLNLSQFQKHEVEVLSIRKEYLIRKHRLQYWHLSIRFDTNSLTGPCRIKTCNGTDTSCPSFLHTLKRRSGINPDLMNFLLPNLIRIILLLPGKNIFDT